MRVPSRLLVPLLAVLVALTACTGGGEEPVSEGASPEQVLADAREALASTSGLRLSLTTDDLPEGVAGITGAEGVATTAPAFEGELSVVIAGSTVTVPVVSVDGTVHAQLPFTQDYSEVDPSEYGAPDPAQLIDPDTGFPSLLTETEGLEQGESVRGGTDNAEVLTEYTGTVPGSAMQEVIPSASGDTFDVAWQVSDSGELRKAVLTGVFYPDSEPMTYTVEFTDYGLEQEITAP